MFTLPFDVQEMQFKILDAITDYLNETAARILLKAKGVTRIMKAYNYHAPNYQNSIANLMEALLDKGLEHLDIPTVISGNYHMLTLYSRSVSILSVTKDWG